MRRHNRSHKHDPDHPSHNKLVKQRKLRRAMKRNAPTSYFTKRTSLDEQSADILLGRTQVKESS